MLSICVLPRKIPRRLPVQDEFIFSGASDIHFSLILTLALILTLTLTLTLNMNLGPWPNRYTVWTWISFIREFCLYENSLRFRNTETACNWPKARLHDPFRNIDANNSKSSMLIIQESQSFYISKCHRKTYNVRLGYFFPENRRKHPIILNGLWRYINSLLGYAYHLFLLIVIINFL